MHHASPATFRPDHPAGGFVPTAPFPLEDATIAGRMAEVILDHARDGEATELRHFREDPRTRDLTADQIALHIGRASRIADKRVIRQDAVGLGQSKENDAVGFDTAGAVHGIREAAPGEFGLPDLGEKSDEDLITIGAAAAGVLITDDAVVGALLTAGMRPAQISRIWDRLMLKVAAGLAHTRKPSIGAIAKAARS